MLNVKISCKLNKFADVFVSGENLLNTAYQIYYDYPMPGITVIGGVNVHIGKN